LIKNFFNNKLGIVVGGSGLVGGGSINFFEKNGDAGFWRQTVRN